MKNLREVLVKAGYIDLQDYVEHLADKHHVDVDIARSLLYSVGLENIFTTYEEELKKWQPRKK